MNDRAEKFWVVVASKDHVEHAMAEGIAQANHGKEAPLKRMKPNDYVLFYSGKQTLGKPEKCQKFTAIGQVKEGEIYQVQISAGFAPFRRNMLFFENKDISVLPLIDSLQFIKNKESWGYAFRYGFFEINQHDFDVISSQMLLKKDD